MNRSDCGLWKGENLREIERKALFAHRKSRNEAEKSRPNEKHSKRFLESCHDFANETPKHQGICLLAHPMFVAGIAIDKLRGYTGIRCNCSIAQAPLPPLTQMESNRNSRPEDLQSPATDGGKSELGIERPSHSPKRCSSKRQGLPKCAEGSMLQACPRKCRDGALVS